MVKDGWIYPVWSEAALMQKEVHKRLEAARLEVIYLERLEAALVSLAERVTTEKDGRAAGGGS